MPALIMTSGAQAAAPRVAAIRLCRDTDAPPAAFSQLVRQEKKLYDNRRHCHSLRVQRQPDEVLKFVEPERRDIVGVGIISIIRWRQEYNDSLISHAAVAIIHKICVARKIVSHPWHSESWQCSCHADLTCSGQV